MEAAPQMTIERPTTEEIEAARARDAASPAIYFDTALDGWLHADDRERIQGMRDRRMLLAEVNRLQQLVAPEDDFRRWPGMDEVPK